MLLGDRYCMADGNIKESYNSVFCRKLKLNFSVFQSVDWDCGFVLDDN